MALVRVPDWREKRIFNFERAMILFEPGNDLDAVVATRCFSANSVKRL
jgi:hypothetical protein